MDQRVSHDYEEAAAAMKLNFKNEDDNYADDVDGFELDDQQEQPSDSSGTGLENREDEVDPLDAYMQEISQQVEELDEIDRQKLEAERNAMQVDSDARVTAQKSHLEDAGSGGEEEEVEDEDEESLRRKAAASGNFATVEELIAFVQKKSSAKKKDIVPVDHSTLKYHSFRKSFYVETPEIGRMTDEEVREYRLSMDNIKIRGIKCPRPIKNWYQAGLSAKALEVILKDLKYETPTPIQAQAIPAVMSGRDLIGIAKTGSGKTIAFMLPMFRHVMDQPSLGPNEGPVALIMTPTRELAMQTYTECMRFARVLGLRVVCAYGGAPVKDQIADLKRGAEIVICTPGRMIDLLIANSGRVTNLKRVTYLVLDEADRMFDMGFGPQVLKIIGNIRPDKQAVLFSATFPRQMDLLARKVLVKPVEIVVGGISTVCEDVEQIVEIVRDDDKFLRLLSVLGEWYESRTERILIFVSRQDGADHLLRDLLKRGYPCMSLHGGKDQADRDSTIADFKAGNIPILVATSVAARGLDVKDLGLVINYDCPNHMEDYVHRVGRTGRAGQKGTAYTFITPEQERFAPDIVKALKTSSIELPPELVALSEGFLAKVRAGEAQSVGSGFGGKGLERIDEERTAFRRSQKRAFGEDEDEEPAEEDKEGEKSGEKEMIEAVASDSSKKPSAEQLGSAPRKTASSSDPKKVPVTAIKAVQQAAAQITAKLSTSSSTSGNGGIAAAQDVLAAINARYRGASAPVTSAASPSLSANPAPGSGVIYPLYEARALGDGTSSMTQTIRGYFCEIDINDYPQMTRWKITSKDTISSVIEYSETSVIVRGHYFPPGKQPLAGERRLHLRVEGVAEFSVERARSEIQRIMVEATVEAAERGGIDYSRYNL